jgi:hypothetical protein
VEVSTLSDERTCLYFVVQSVSGQSRGDSSYIIVSFHTTGFPFRSLLRLARITVQVSTLSDERTGL